MSIQYAYYGWDYYLSEMIFKFSLTNLANFLILSVVTLSFSLKVEQLKNESKEILMAAKFGNISVQEVIGQNRQKLDELEQTKAKAKSRRIKVYVWSLVTCLVVIASYLFMYFEKQKLLHEKDLTSESAVILDCVPIIIYFCFFVALFGVLIKFKALQKKYDIQIKKSQLFCTASLGLSTIALGVF